ncbi:hypothetical protein UF64_12020 [Thalassospira sp. HJ]|uniref:hypothetical protein n=1 Tax=Thalassospira sp. HJ TaxID=1616823 RepID=UPI0005CE4EA8|nr:hypothetical protein [Thalassospira sp. HJ]KJE35338.1 hypothetical protein UF64_12020 [Thalassospira sp. HJ]
MPTNRDKWRIDKPLYKEPFGNVSEGFFLFSMFYVAIVDLNRWMRFGGQSGISALFFQAWNGWKIYGKDVVC